MLEKLAMWGRIGPTWSAQRTKNSAGKVTTNVGTLDAELAWIFGLVDHVGIATTLALALPINGSSVVDAEAGYANRLGIEQHRDVEVSLLVVALQLGIVGHL